MTEEKPELQIDMKAMTGGLALTLFMADAIKAATPEQRGLIKQILAGLERPEAEGGTSLKTVATQVALAVPGWSPDDETLRWMESLTGKKLR